MGARQMTDEDEGQSCAPSSRMCVAVDVGLLAKARDAMDGSDRVDDAEVIERALRMCVGGSARETSGPARQRRSTELLLADLDAISSRASELGVQSDAEDFDVG